MAHVLAQNVDESITPNPGKEKGVWMALDSLYFEDKFAVKEITNDMILEKRKSLEGKAGDRSSLRQMKERWCQRHKINPYDDPNFGARPEKSNRADPLQKLTAGLYAQIDEAVRAEYTSEVQELKDRLVKLEDDNDELKDKLGETAATLTKTSNELAHALEKVKQAEKAKLRAETIAEQTVKSLDDYKRGAEKHFTETLRSLRNDFEQQASHQQDEISKIAQELGSTRERYADEVDKQKEQNENIRQKYMVKSHNLEIKVKELETLLASEKNNKNSVEQDKRLIQEQVQERLEELFKINELLSNICSSSSEHSIEILNGLTARLTAIPNKTDLNQVVSEISVQLNKLMDSEAKHSRSEKCVN